MTCKDCIHYDICHNNFKNIDLNEEMTDEHCCVYFKDKSRIIELPCKVGDDFFIIAQRFEKGKYTEYFIDERQVSCFEYDGKNLTVYDFDGIDFDIDNIYFDKSKAEAKLKEFNDEHQ